MNQSHLELTNRQRATLPVQIALCYEQLQNKQNPKRFASLLFVSFYWFFLTAAFAETAEAIFLGHSFSFLCDLSVLGGVT